MAKRNKSTPRSNPAQAPLALDVPPAPPAPTGKRAPEKAPRPAPQPAPAPLFSALTGEALSTACEVVGWLHTGGKLDIVPGKGALTVRARGANTLLSIGLPASGPGMAGPGVSVDRALFSKAVEGLKGPVALSLVGGQLAVDTAEGRKALVATAELPKVTFRTGGRPSTVTVPSLQAEWALSYAGVATQDVVHIRGPLLGGYSNGNAPARVHLANLGADLGIEATIEDDVAGVYEAFANGFSVPNEAPCDIYALRFGNAPGAVGFRVSSEHASLHVESTDMGKPIGFATSLEGYEALRVGPGFWSAIAKASGPVVIEVAGAELKVAGQSMAVQRGGTGALLVAADAAALRDAIDYPEDTVVLAIHASNPMGEKMAVQQDGLVKRMAWLAPVMPAVQSTPEKGAGKGKRKGKVKASAPAASAPANDNVVQAYLALQAQVAQEARKAPKRSETVALPTLTVGRK